MGLSLIDVSFESDLLSEGSTDPGSPDWDQTLQLPKSPVQTKSRSRKSFSQQSLDWDNDFLTCEGVLNPEELSLINSTFRKTEPCSLTIIHEDPKGSTDGDDSLEDLEVHLFDNARASIQKTLGTGEKALELKSSSRKNNPARRSPKKVESASSSSLNKIKGDDEITSSKAASSPLKLWQKAATLTKTIPAKIAAARGNTQTRADNTKYEPANAVQKPALHAKRINGGSHCGNSVLSSVSNSPASANKERSKTTSTPRTNTSVYGAMANKASTKTCKTITIKNTTSNPTVTKEGTFVKLPLSTSPASAYGGGVSSVSYSSSLLGRDSDRVSSSPSCKRGKENKAHSSRLSAGGLRDISLRRQAKQTSQINHVTSAASRGNRPMNDTNNKGIPSGSQNPLSQNVRASSIQQSKFSRATTGMSKIDSVNVRTNNKIEGSKHAAHKKTNSGDSVMTQTSTSRRRSRSSSISLP